MSEETRAQVVLDEIALWEMLKSGQRKSEILESLPDQLHSSSARIVDDFQRRYESREHALDWAFADLEARVGGGSRKDYALAIQKDYASHLQALLFARLSDKDYSQMIWKQLKPKEEE